MASISPTYSQTVPVGGTFHIQLEQSIAIYGQRSTDCSHNPPFFSWILTRAVSRKPEFGELTDGGKGERYSDACSGTVPVRIVNYTPDKEKVLERAEEERKGTIKDYVIFWESSNDSAIIYVETGLQFEAESENVVSKPKEQPASKPTDVWDRESPADFPTMKVGDKWVFSGYSAKHGTDTYTEEIVGSGKDHFLYSSAAKKAGSERMHTIQKNESYPKMALIEGLEFPLHVGKKWKLEYEGKSIDNQSWRYTNNYKVLKVESKSVKAGTFKTFKIRLTQNIQGQRPGRKYIWYAPDVKRIIYTKPSWRKGEELISYELSSPE